MRLAEMIYTEEEMQELRNEIEKLKAELQAKQKVIQYYRKEKKKLKEYNGELIENHKKDIDILCEENRKLKLHIEAKDKAYTALLKDYEEIKEKNKELKAEIGEWLNAIRDLHIRY